MRYSGGAGGAMVVYLGDQEEERMGPLGELHS